MREKEKIGPDRVEKTPQEMLLEARDGLIKCRELFVLSTIMFLHRPITKDGLVFWGNMWFNASLEEQRITRELVAPAKLQTGGFRTVPTVEENVRKKGAEFIDSVFWIKPKDALDLATAIVDPHIEFTKQIQKKMGVPENSLFEKQQKPRKCTIFAGYGTTPKPQRERVAC